MKLLFLPRILQFPHWPSSRLLPCASVYIHETRIGLLFADPRSRKQSPPRPGSKERARGKKRRGEIVFSKFQLACRAYYRACYTPLARTERAKSRDETMTRVRAAGGYASKRYTRSRSRAFRSIEFSLSLSLPRLLYARRDRRVTFNYHSRISSLPGYMAAACSLSLAGLHVIDNPGVEWGREMESGGAGFFRLWMRNRFWRIAEFTLQWDLPGDCIP